MGLSAGAALSPPAFIGSGIYSDLKNRDQMLLKREEVVLYDNRSFLIAKK
jgi:hypothetical protein